MGGRRVKENPKYGFGRFAWPGRTRKGLLMCLQYLWTAIPAVRSSSIPCKKRRMHWSAFVGAHL